MPRLSAEDIAAIKENKLESFGGKRRFLVDDKGYGILHHLVMRKEESATEALVKAEMEERQLSPYLFAYDDTKSSLPEVLLSPIDLAFNRETMPINSSSGLPLIASEQKKLLNALLEAPLGMDAEYLQRLLATAVAELQKGDISKERRIQVVGSMVSLLCGRDVLQLLEDKAEVYQGHLTAWRGETSDGLPTEGFDFYTFLPLRIFFAMGMLVDLQLGYFIDSDLPKVLKDLYANDVIKVRKHLIEELRHELIRDMQTYCLARYGYHIGQRHMLVADYTAQISSLLQGAIKSIKALADNQSMIIALDWEYKAKKRKTKKADAEADKEPEEILGAHALYLQIHKIGDKWNLLLHNLGDKNSDHKPDIKAGLCRPKKLGKLTAKAWGVSEAGYQYLNEVFKHIYPAADFATSLKVFYDQKTGGRTQLLVGKEVSIITETYKPRPIQRAGNCVSAGHESAREELFTDYAWLHREEKRFAADFCGQQATVVPSLDAKIWHAVADSPIDTLADPVGSEGRRAKLIANVADKLRETYSERYKNIQTLWNEAPLDMEEFYLDLEFQESSNDKSKPVPVALDALVDKGGSQWIKGQLGSGKSTLMQKIAFRWAHERLGKGYKQVILFPLRKLKSVKICGATLEEQISDAIAQIHFDEALDDKARADLTAKLFHPAIKDQTLWLLDGYDEIASGLGEAKDKLLAFLQQQAHVITSTRPETLPHGKAHVLIKGLNDEEIGKWIKKYVKHAALSTDSEAEINASIAELQGFLLSNSQIWDLVHSPINLKLVCMAYTHNSLDMKIKTPTELYTALCKMLANRHYERLGKKTEVDAVDLGQSVRYWEPLEKLIAELAYEGFERADVEPGAIIVKTGLYFLKDYRRNWVEEVVQSGVLQPVGPTAKGVLNNMEFLHASFKEYFTAKHLLERMQKDEAGFTLWFRERKFALAYPAVWRFVSGLLPSVELADKWVNLWLQPPYKIETNHATYALLSQLSEVLSDCPFKEQLKCREPLVKSIDEIWGKDMLHLPRSIMKIMRSLSLWQHPRAETWLDQLMSKLDSIDLGDINKLAEILLELKARAIPKLVPLLVHAKPLMRERAAIILAKLKALNPKAIEILTESIKPINDKQVISVVAEAIAELDTLPLEIVESLKKALSEDTKAYDQESKRYLLEALGQAKGLNAEFNTILITHLSGTESEVVSNAAIKVLLSPQSVEPNIIKAIAGVLLNTRESVRKQADKELQKYLSRQFSKSDNKHKALKAMADVILPGLKDDEPEEYSDKKKLTKEQKVRRIYFAMAAVESLKLEDNRIVEALLKLTSTYDFNVRYFAIKTFSKFSNKHEKIEKIIASLKEIANTVASVEIKGIVLEVLAKLNAAEAQEFISKFLNASNSKLHVAACVAIAEMQIKTELIIAKLTESLKGGVSACNPALEALGKIGAINADLLGKIFECSLNNKEIADTAQKALAQMDIKQVGVLDSLFAKLKKADDSGKECKPVQQILAIRTLTKHKPEDKRLIEVLLEKLQHTNKDIARAALEALVANNYQGEEMIAPLMTIATAKSQSQGLPERIKAIEVLGNIKATKAITILEGLVVPEITDAGMLYEDVKIRLKAALALMQITEGKLNNTHVIELLGTKVDDIIWQSANQCQLSIAGRTYSITDAAAVTLWTQVESNPSIKLCKHLATASPASVNSGAEASAASAVNPMLGLSMNASIGPGAGAGMSSSAMVIDGSSIISGAGAGAGMSSSAMAIDEASRMYGAGAGAGASAGMATVFSEWSGAAADTSGAAYSGGKRKRNTMVSSAEGEAASAAKKPRTDSASSGFDH